MYWLTRWLLQSVSEHVVKQKQNTKTKHHNNQAEADKNIPSRKHTHTNNFAGMDLHFKVKRCRVSIMFHFLSYIAKLPQNVRPHKPRVLRLKKNVSECWWAPVLFAKLPNPMPKKYFRWNLLWRPTAHPQYHPSNNAHKSPITPSLTVPQNDPVETSFSCGSLHGLLSHAFPKP